MLISPKVSKHNVYIKLSSFQAALLRYAYRENVKDGVIYLPQDFQYANPRLTHLHDTLYQVFTTNIITPDWDNCVMQPNTSYSERGVHLASIAGSVPDGSAVGLTSVSDGSAVGLTSVHPNLIPTDTDSLIPFALPDCYKQNSVTWAYTTECSQLTPTAASTFRKIVKLMFWVALSWHIDNLYDPIVFPTKMSIFEDFVMRYNIPSKDIETIYRTYSRERSSCMRIVNQLFNKIDPVRPIFFLKDS